MTTPLDNHSRAAHRLPALLFVLAVLVPVAQLLSSAPAALAGSWMQISCENPDGTTASNQGWSGYALDDPGSGSSNSTTCAAQQSMIAKLSALAPVAIGAGEVLEYQPPNGSTLAGGSLSLTSSAYGHGPMAWTTIGAYTPSLEGAGTGFFYCSSESTTCPGGSLGYSGEVTLPAKAGGDLYLLAGCEGAKGSCDEGEHSLAWSEIDLRSADLLLSNTSTPTASNIAGALLSPGARGTQDISLTAVDQGGPGVYAVKVELDGNVIYTGTPDKNNGQCVASGITVASVMMFDAAQPCKQSEYLDIAVPTVSLADGPHTLKVTVEDAAQNSSVVYNGAVSTHNAPENTSPPTVQIPAGESGAVLSAAPGVWSAPSGAGSIAYTYQWEDCESVGSNCQEIPAAQASTYTPTANDAGHTLRALITAADEDGTKTVPTTPTALPQGSSPGLINDPNSLPTPIAVTTGAGSATSSPGTPNGSPASHAAIIDLGVRPTIARSYSHRALNIQGHLLTATGQPITGATVEVLSQTRGGASAVLIAHVSSGAAGAFDTSVPAGPSRIITIAYRAYANDTSYAAVAKVTESVTAGLVLHVTPRHTESTGTITLSGQVLGPLPLGGVTVSLEVWYLGRWVPFRDPTTDSRGRFTLKYRFEGSVGKFPFRVKALNDQNGFPFTAGYSPRVVVVTR